MIIYKYLFFIIIVFAETSLNAMRAVLIPEGINEGGAYLEKMKNNLLQSNLIKSYMLVFFLLPFSLNAQMMDGGLGRIPSGPEKEKLLEALRLQRDRASLALRYNQDQISYPEYVRSRTKFDALKRLLKKYGEGEISEHEYKLEKNRIKEIYSSGDNCGTNLANVAFWNTE